MTACYVLKLTFRLNEDCSRCFQVTASRAQIGAVTGTSWASLWFNEHQTAFIWSVTSLSLSRVSTTVHCRLASVSSINRERSMIFFFFRNSRFNNAEWHCSGLVVLSYWRKWSYISSPYQLICVSKILFQTSVEKQEINNHFDCVDFMTSIGYFHENYVSIVQKSSYQYLKAKNENFQ